MPLSSKKYQRSRIQLIRRTHGARSQETNGQSWGGSVPKTLISAKASAPITDKVARLGEIAFHNGWLNADDLQRIDEPQSKNSYGQYLLSLAKESE